VTGWTFIVIDKIIILFVTCKLHTQPKPWLTGHFM